MHELRQSNTNQNVQITFSANTYHELNKSINKNIVFCAYNISYIPQMGICHVAIINRGTEYGYTFYRARKWTSITGDTTI